MTDKTICNHHINGIALVFAMSSEAQPFIDYLKTIAHTYEIKYATDRQQIIEWTLDHPKHLLGFKINKLYTAITGIGKVNAAIVSTQLIAKHNIQWIINIGVIGLIKPNVQLLTPIVISQVSYHDVDLTMFGYQYGQIPGLPATFKLDNRHIVHCFKQNNIAFETGDIVSGDRFITSKDEQLIQSLGPQVCGIDMELAGIGQACLQAQNMMLSSVKLGSDYIFKKENHNLYTQSMQAYPLTVNKLLQFLFV